MAIYSVTGAELTSVADAIRAKGGTSELLAFPSGFVSAVQDITTGGMSLSAADEGKVVYNGALSLQGSMSVMSNGSYDTTLFSQVSVSIPDAVLVSKTITSNGTYNPASDNADAYSQVVVSVPSEGGGGSIGSENYLVITRQSSGAFIDSEIVTIESNTFINNSYIKEFIGENVASIGQFAFSSCSYLSIVNIPKCELVDMNAFFGCLRLTSIDLPVCSKVSTYGFYGCNSLNYINLPQCEIIASAAFYSCSSLKSVYLPECSSIAQNAFYNCKSISIVDAHECDYIGVSAFNSCTSLTICSLPKVSHVGSSAFYRCEKLENVNLPNLRTVEERTFQGCTSLSELRLTSASQIKNYAFLGCTKLVKLDLLSSSIVTLTSSASNCFGSTPITNNTLLGYYGSVYVPASLVDAYKSANYWSNISDRITAYVEG